jgi:PST family polysaccharide transporter/lipopolysaccharide exporter
MAIGLLVSGLSNVAVVSFDKELNFQRRFVFRSVPTIVDLVVSVLLAWILRSPWALAFGWVAARTAASLGSYLVHSFRPRLRWDGPRIRELFQFGIWLLGSQVLIYLTLNLDDLLVGKVVGTAALGLYQMAFTLSQLTTTQITTVINTVAFPTYSKLQGQPERLRVAYVTTVQFVAFLSFPVAAGLWFVGEDLVATFLGERWLPVIPAFEVLLIWGLIRSLLATTGPLLRGVGKPGLATKVQLLQFTMLALAIYPLTRLFGIVGAAWATVAAAVIPDGWALYLAGRESTASIRSLGRALAFPLVNAMLMTGVLYAVRSLFDLPGGVLLLVWAPIVGGIVYFTLVFIARHWLGYAPEGLLAGATVSK